MPYSGLVYPGLHLEIHADQLATMCDGVDPECIEKLTDGCKRLLQNYMSAYLAESLFLSCALCCASILPMAKMTRCLTNPISDAKVTTDRLTIFQQLSSLLPILGSPISLSDRVTVEFRVP